MVEYQLYFLWSLIRHPVVEITVYAADEIYIAIMVRVFANGPGDNGSIPCRVVPKTQKIALHATLLNTSIIMYGSRIKWSNPGKGVVPSPTPWSSSDHPRLRLPTLHFTIYICICVYIYIYIYSKNSKILYTHVFSSYKYMCWRFFFLH